MIRFSEIVDGFVFLLAGSVRGDGLYPGLNPHFTQVQVTIFTVSIIPMATIGAGGPSGRRFPNLEKGAAAFTQKPPSHEGPK